VKMCFARVDNQPHSNVHVQFIIELIVMSSALTQSHNDLVSTSIAHFKKLAKKKTLFCTYKTSVVPLLPHKIRTS